MVDQNTLITTIEKYSVLAIAQHYTMDQLRYLYHELTGFEPSLGVKDPMVMATALKRSAKFMAQVNQRDRDEFVKYSNYLRSALESWKRLSEPVRNSDHLRPSKEILELLILSAENGIGK